MFRRPSSMHSNQAAAGSYWSLRVVHVAGAAMAHSTRAIIAAPGGKAEQQATVAGSGDLAAAAAAAAAASDDVAALLLFDFPTTQSPAAFRVAKDRYGWCDRPENLSTSSMHANGSRLNCSNHSTRNRDGVNTSSHRRRNVAYCPMCIILRRCGSRRSALRLTREPPRRSPVPRRHSIADEHALERLLKRRHQGPPIPRWP